MWAPAVEMQEKKDGIVIKAELPEVDPKNVNGWIGSVWTDDAWFHFETYNRIKIEQIIAYQKRTL